jgi:hypothetical protein
MAMLVFCRFRQIAGTAVFRQRSQRRGSTSEMGLLLNSSERVRERGHVDRVRGNERFGHDDNVFAQLFQEVGGHALTDDHAEDLDVCFVQWEGVVWIC